MTYKARLEELLAYSVQKSKAYIDIVSKEGQSNSARFKKARTEYEDAENAYISFLLLMEGCGANLHEQLPQSLPIPGMIYRDMIGN